MRRRLSDAEAERVLEAERKRRRQWLSDVPIFAAVASQDNAEEFLTAVAEKLEVKTVGRKECVVSKGEYGAEMYFIVRGEAEALEVQTRLKYGSSTPPPVPLPPFELLPPGRRLNTGSEGNERATEAIKECALRKKASAVWQAALVDPYVAPARVVQEREIPADVQGCCCGAEP